MSCERHDVTISVITWNVMHWFGYTCCECGELIAPGRECSCGWRCGEILQRIRSWVEHGTDLIYLQEVSQHLLDELYEVCAAKGYTVISSIYHRELMGVAMLLSGRFRIQTVQRFRLQSSVRALEDHKAFYQRSSCFLAEWCTDPGCSVVHEDGKRCPRVHDTDSFATYAYTWSYRKAWRRWQNGKRWVRVCNFCGNYHNAAHYPDMCPKFETPISDWEYKHKRLYQQSHWFVAERCWFGHRCRFVHDSGHRCRFVHDTDPFAGYLDRGGLRPTAAGAAAGAKASGREVCGELTNASVEAIETEHGLEPDAGKDASCDNTGATEAAGAPAISTSTGGKDASCDNTGATEAADAPAISTSTGGRAETHWAYACNYCGGCHDGAAHPEKCPRYDELIVSSLKCYDNEFPIVVVNDTVSNEMLTLSSFHMPKPRGATPQQKRASLACLWGLFTRALSDAGRQHNARGFLIGGDLNLTPEEYGSVGLFAPAQNLKFLKQDAWSGESTEFSTCFCGPGSLRAAETANGAALDNVITNMTWVTGVDQTEYGEKSRAPSDHIPVSVQCTYVRKTEIPAQSLNYGNCWYSDEDLGSLDLPLDYHSIRWADFSRNRLTGAGLEALNISWEFCADLEEIRLYRNHLDDSSCAFVCKLLEQCRALRGLHLSHNRLTEAGVMEIVRTAARCRDASQVCLWLRIENNDFKDPGALQAQLAEEPTVCPVTSSCTAWHCERGCKIHVPRVFWPSEQTDKQQAAAAEEEEEHAPFWAHNLTSSREKIKMKHAHTRRHLDTHAGNSNLTYGVRGSVSEAAFPRHKL